MPIESVDPSELSRKLLLLGEFSSPAVVIAVPKYDPKRFLEEFRTAFNARSDRQLAIAETAYPNVESLFNALEYEQQFTACLGFESWSDLEFQRLDANRSILLSFNVLILVLTELSLDRFFDNCPHISSVVGAAVYSVHHEALDLSTTERENRLAFLRSKFSLDDQNFLSQVEAGNFKGDPYANEWLILLDRGDLIHAPLG